jgi:hypothetical protein
MGFFRAAQVGLVTPVRDGMNLVAKEFVAAQDSEDPGVLILSSLAGAARELSGALQVNPHDTRGVALAIQVALSMPLTERLERHAANLAVLRRNDIAAWHTRMISALATAREAPNVILGGGDSGSRQAAGPGARAPEPQAPPPSVAAVRAPAGIIARTAVPSDVVVEAGLARRARARSTPPLDAPPTTAASGEWEAGGSGRRAPVPLA